MTGTSEDSPVVVPPRAVQIARGLLVFVAMYHLAFPLLELFQTHLAGAKLIQGVTQNSFLLIVTTVLIWKLPSGHRWALRPATFSQVLTIITGAILWPTASDLIVIVLIADALSVMIIILLWVPSSARTFFTLARHHASVRATPSVL